jgi:L-arabinonolactonase
VSAVAKMSARIRVELYSQQTDVLGEGPLWSQREQALYWLDIGSKKLFRRAPGDMAADSWVLGEYPGCLAELTSSAIAIAMGDGVHRFDLSSSAVELLHAAPPRRAGTRFNDGKVDPRGRWWIGTMQSNFGPAGEPIAVERSDGALYRFDQDGRVHTVEDGVGIANTLAWSPDARHFYFADSLRGEIYAYDFDVDSGTVHNRRVFVDAAHPGVPDGSAMDVDGCLWNARWDAGVLLRFAPSGRLDRSIQLPVPRPTSCIFGGTSLDTLFVTSARLGLTAEQLRSSDLSGSVFALTHAGQGMPVPPFARSSTTPS